VREGYERFVAPGFQHHNPWFKGDADSLRAGMEQAAAKFPHTTIEFQRAFEDGNLVAVHSRVQHAPKVRPVSVVHIFRFKGERIAELWDIAVQQPGRLAERARPVLGGGRFLALHLDVFVRATFSLSCG
jgi:predicted SnoaL-like aldol condensation-catalyzing enzyme